jgi:hypothetical protein
LVIRVETARLAGVPGGFNASSVRKDPTGARRRKRWQVFGVPHLFASDETLIQTLCAGEVCIDWGRDSRVAFRSHLRHHE